MTDAAAEPALQDDKPSIAAHPASEQHDAPETTEVMRQLRARASTFPLRPEIFKRRAPGQPDACEELGVQVSDWNDLRRRRELDMLQAYGSAAMQPTLMPAPGGGFVSRFDSYDRLSLRPMAKSVKSSKKTTAGNGRTYTSKYRGVHQTFPTRRWEAQFRRSGKPTSLGCFDHEEEAARAYDKMMLWCELHNAIGVKGGVTNFDPGEYEGDIPWLQQVTQDELVQILRSDGRRQAAARTVRQKREPGQGFGHQGMPGTSTGASSDADERRSDLMSGLQ